MVRTLPLQDDTRPQPARVLAIAAALAVHVLAFLLLLLPLSGPRLDITASDPIPERRWERETVPPPPIPPEPVRQQQSQPPRATPQQATTLRQEAIAPVLSESGVLPALEPVPSIAPTAAEAGTNAGADTAPMHGAALAYVVAPAPVYPRDAARIGAQGTVLLKVLVDVDGSPLEVSLERSSGNRSLDRAAREQVLRYWKFQPAMRGGRAVQAYGLVPIAFTMQ